MKRALKAFRNLFSGNLLAELTLLRQQLAGVDRDLSIMREAIGRVEGRQLLSAAASFNESEFQVFSQFGEDGLLQYLIHHIEVENRTFVEFGVEDYTEATTRFLATNDRWRGLILDGDATNIRKIKWSRLYHRCSVTAVHAFITAENINTILAENGFAGPLGILSIDVDGNDYWIWKAIDCTNPIIVVCEYNHRFGAQRRVTVPYQSNFDRFKIMSPPLYFGASLAALTALGTEKGYSLVGCSANGLNAFFVRSDRLPSQLCALSAEEAFKPGTFSESHRPAEGMEKKSPEEEQTMIAHFPIVEV